MRLPGSRLMNFADYIFTRFVLQPHFNLDFVSGTSLKFTRFDQNSHGLAFISIQSQKKTFI